MSTTSIIGSGGMATAIAALAAQAGHTVEVIRRTAADGADAGACLPAVIGLPANAIALNNFPVGVGMPGSPHR